MAEEGLALGRLLFPQARQIKSLEQYEALYPPRLLPPGAMVTRYAPSPTGFMHIGGIFVSLINKILALQTGGVFFLRIEDTDTKRSIPGALDTIINAFAAYGLTSHEGLYRAEDGTLQERGAYGPYTQTERAAVYRDHAIALIQRGLAYPCFTSAEEIDELRARQIAEGVKPGMYGRWAPWRDAPLEKVKNKVREGAAFTIRLRAPDDASGLIKLKDGVRGVISMPANDLDTVLLKSDGIPTYHFAHAVDDHLMRTTHVIRGDEWITSTPLHFQLFQALGFPPVEYVHVPPIQKIEHTEELDEKTGVRRTVESRRKLSKRKDPEANIEFYDELGIPPSATIDYLLNIANSTFEEWREKNPHASYTKFPLKLNKMSPSGALSDVAKLRSISKDVIARMSAEEIYPPGVAWARKYDPELAVLMIRYEERTKLALGIERDTPRGNKRIVTWQDLRPQLAYFYDELYERIDTFDFPEQIPPDERRQLLLKLAKLCDSTESNVPWFEKVRTISIECGYAPDLKQYKASPQSYKGHVGDVSMLIRVALSGVRQTPDLLEIVRILGPQRYRERLSRFC